MLRQKAFILDIFRVNHKSRFDGKSTSCFDDEIIETHICIGVPMFTPIRKSIAVKEINLLSDKMI